MSQTSEYDSSSGPAEAPAGPQAHPRRWLILGVLCLPLLLVLLDNTVLNVALPSITDSLGATTSDLQWMMNAYTLVLAGLLMTTGSLADRIGRKRALTLGLTVFVIFSAIAAFSVSPLQLILARVGMGVGAAFLMPSTLAVLMQVFDDAGRPKAIAIWTAVASGGVAIGPVVGGLLLDHFWWGSVFLINLPLGAAALVALFLLVPESRESNSRKTDVPGVLLSIAMGVGLVYAVISVPEYGWGSANVLVPLVIGLIALIGFITWERKSQNPMLDLSLFKNPKFTGAVSSGSLTSIAMAGSLFLFTQYLQFVLDYTPLQAGLGVMPMAATLMVMTTFSPKLNVRIGTAATLATGLSLMGVGLFVLSFIGISSSYLPTLAGLMVMGGGVGIALPASSNALMSSIPPQRAGMASGLNSTMQEFGSSLGVAVLGSLVAAQFAARLPEFLPEEVGHSVGLALSSAAQSTEGAAAVAQVKEAFVSGVSVSLLFAGIVAVLAGIVAWALLRRAPAESVAPAAPVQEDPVLENSVSGS